MEKRIVIIDDHPIVRKGFAQLINREADLTVVGEAEDHLSAQTVISETQPDLALVDLTLKESDGLELIKTINAQYPKVKTMVISLHDERVYAERALRAGAKGYIMKSEATENVMTAIRTVLKGSMYLSDDMHARMLSQFAGNSKKETSPIDVLSDREFEVFRMIGDGLETREIAKRLTLSVKTIETYKSHLKTKLDLHSSTELIQRAVEWNLLQK
ncbi:MAG: response regulator transcription factor [Spirochaetaceae bacterium]|nr:response regulator transcription factor [Spirochaetaceae bacterium]MCF7947978.1 response regulator transcription factor [Spirochaetia bacterium]MCF7950869.1 response regulator transcription factor [Spirochaetaceae bacterium]